MTGLPFLDLPDLGPLWEFCRDANRYIAAVAAVGVGYRLMDMALDPARWRDSRARHLMGWFAYIAAGLLVASLGARYYAAGTTPANYLSGARMALSLAAIGLTAWWPHPHKFVPIEERTDA